MPRVRRILPDAYINQFRGRGVYLLRFVADSLLTDRANITALDLAKGITDRSGKIARDDRSNNKDKRSPEWG